MITIGDAILAINPDAVFDYESVDQITWRNRTKPIDKDDILQKYEETIEKDKLEFEKANRKGPIKIHSHIRQKQNLLLYI